MNNTVYSDEQKKQNLCAYFQDSEWCHIMIRIKTTQIKAPTLYNQKNQAEIKIFILSGEYDYSVLLNLESHLFIKTVHCVSHFLSLPIRWLNKSKLREC